MRLFCSRSINLILAFVFALSIIFVDVFVTPSANAAYTTGSAQFGTSGRYLSVAGSSDFAVGTGDFTVEWWQYMSAEPGTAPAQYPRVWHINSSPPFGVSIEGSGDPTFYLWLNGAQALGTLQDFSNSYLNQWVHFAVSRTSSTVRVFANGTLLGSQVNSYNVTAASTALTVGNHAGQTAIAAFPGRITNFHFVKGTSLYTSNFDITTAPIQPMADSKLLLRHSSSGTLLTDSSPVGRTVTNTGSVAFSSSSPSWTDTPNVIATGTNAYLCHQTVTDPTNVVAYRLISGDCVVEFKNVGTTVWTRPTGAGQLWTLIIGGGGAGGGDEGGGGGAGGYIEETITVTSNSVSVVVGDGGISSSNDDEPGGNGGSSQFGDLTAIGGGGGGTAGNSDARAATVRYGQPGGSGGGGAGESKSVQGGSATSGQGNPGGSSVSSRGSGGGGAGSSGIAGSSGGSGGAGKSSGITGTLSFRAGGGGGGMGNTSGGTTTNNGGSGVGGRGGSVASSGIGTAGAKNTGSGGGGGGGTAGLLGFAGGSGIVIIRYTPDTTAPTFSSASVGSGGTTLALTYNETLSATTAATSAFTVSRTLFGGGSGSVSVSSVSVSGSTITLNLGSTVFAGDTVTVSYADPSGSDDASAVQDVAGNDAASLTNQAVTNNSTQKQNQSALSIDQSTLVYGGTLTLTTSGGLGTGAVGYSENSAACSISGTTLTGVAAGDCIVTATKAADTNYLETTTTKTLTITQATHTITFASLANKTLGMSAVTLIASASSGLTVSFSSSDAAICSTSGSNGTTLTLVAPGTCTITASQGGDTNYQAASDVTRSFTISPTLLLTTPTSPSSSLTASYGASYSLDLSLSLSGGSGGTTYAITTGSLPPGLSLNTSTGLISGTPTSLGDSALVITATDSNGASSATSSFTISVVTGSATATITFSSTTFTFGITNQITVTTSTAGTVRFFANGRVIKNCKAQVTTPVLIMMSGGGGSHRAICSYRPATRRPLTIRARLTPTDLNIGERVSTSAQFLVQRRTGVRG